MSMWTLFIAGLLILVFVLLTWIVIESLIEQRLKSKAKNAKIIHEITKTNHDTVRLHHDIERMTKEQGCNGD